MSEELADLQVIEEIQRGNKRAFDILVLKYQYKVFRIITRYISDPSEVLDVTQEIFIKVYKSIANFRGESSFYTWLYRIAINTAKNQLISQNKHLPELSYEIADVEKYVSKHQVKECSTPEKLLIREETEQIFYRVLDELSNELKITITLREIEGLSYDEISAVMDCPIGTVRSRLFRARAIIEEKAQALLQK